MGWGRWTCKCVDDDEPRVDGVCGSVNAARALRLRAGFAASVFDAWLLPSLVHKHPYKVSYIDSELLPTGEPIESHQFVHCASCSLSERASLDAIDATKWRSGSKNTRPSEG